MPKVILPNGESVDSPLEITETPESIATRELAEQQAEAERLLQVERDANGGKTLAEIEVERLASEGKGDDNVTSVEIANEQGLVVKYNLDDKGNAIDDKGNIAYTVDQLKDLEETSDEVNQITEIAAVSGIKILDETGVEKTYDNTIKGFAEREVDIRTIALQEGSTKAIEEFFGANPDFESMYNYKRTYGSLENYSAFVDYSKITLDVTNNDSMIDIIYKAEIAKGNTPERAKRLAQFSSSDNTLAPDAKEALEFLKTRQSTEVSAANDREIAILKIETDKENAFFGVSYNEKGEETVLNVPNSIYDVVVVKGSIGELTIPKDGLLVKDAKGSAKHFSRKQIFDYISRPVKEVDGEYYTQAQLDEYARVSDTKQLVATYIRNLLGGDISQIAKAAEAKHKVETIRRLVVRSSTGGNAGGGGSKGKVIIPIP